MYLKLVILVMFLLTARLPQALAQAAPAQTASKQSSAKPQTYTREGISVEFGVAPISSEGKTAELMAGTESRVRFKVLDANAGKTLGNLRPAAWIDRRDSGQSADPRECREKIQSFLQPGFNKRPTIDLNVYFILALNHEPNISVIDPLSGFGGSKLYNLVSLPGSGEDWVMSADKKRLYISLPSVNQVAVVDIQTWKVIANLEAGIRPMRVALQHDGRYLWVGNDGPGEKGNGITVIDTVTLKVVAQIITGAGHHEIDFTQDDSLAFVTNRQDGTLSAIDTRRLVRVTNIRVGMLPGAIAFSSLGKAVYVANEGEGTIVVLDDWGREIQARMKAQPGLGALRMTPDGRFGLVVNKATNSIYVFDVASNRIIHAVPIGSGADQVTFTRQFAYVRSADNEFVTMIKLADLGKEAAVSRFPAGQKAPQESPAESLADAIVSAPEDGAVLIANPADKMIYFYTEGMAAPMGSFQNYRRDPKALLVLDKSLRETAPGEYTTTVRLTEAGNYDVAFLLDSPRVVNCFTMTVTENPGLPKPPQVAIRVEPLLKETTARVGESYNLRFKVTDSNSHQPKPNIEDMGVLVFLAPGIWQQRQWARHVGDGLYEINFVPPQTGVYYVYFQCPSLGVQFNQIIPLTLEATKK
jgi:DNA-binding beta-propeller fold protein YncE